MNTGYKQLLDEKENCSIKLQKIIDRNKDIELTSFKFRNLCEIIIEDEIHPDNIVKFYQDFAFMYEEFETLKELKENLLSIMK